MSSRWTRTDLLTAPTWPQGHREGQDESVDSPTNRRRLGAVGLGRLGLQHHRDLVCLRPLPHRGRGKEPATGHGQRRTWLAISLFAAGFCVAAFTAPVAVNAPTPAVGASASLAIWYGAGDRFDRGPVLRPRRLSLSGARLAAAGSRLGVPGVRSGLLQRHAAQDSNRRNVGRISGIGWGSGYVGGIVVMLLAYALFIEPDVRLFGVTTEGGLKYRALALVVAVWFAIWAVPIFLAVPEIPPTPGVHESVLCVLSVLIHDVRACSAPIAMRCISCSPVPCSRRPSDDLQLRGGACGVGLRT